MVDLRNRIATSPPSSDGARSDEAGFHIIVGTARQMGLEIGRLV
jgi:ribosomal protein L11